MRGMSSPRSRQTPGRRRRGSSPRPAAIQPAFSCRSCRCCARGWSPGSISSSTACSGISGAGRKLDETYLFVERAESAKAYGLTKHRHLSEIEEQLALHTGGKTVIQFNPHLAPMRVGIATTITVPVTPGTTIEAVYASLEAGVRHGAVRPYPAERRDPGHGACGGERTGSTFRR